MDEYAQGVPAPVLRPYVGFYTGYRQRGLAPAVHRGLPSPYLTLIFTLDEPLVVAAHPDSRQAPDRFDTLLGGLHVAPALITHDGSQSGVQIALRPLGCRALFGLPAAELAHLDVDVSAVLGARTVTGLRDRLCSAPDWPSRFAVLDRAFTALLGRPLPTRLGRPLTTRPAGRLGGFDERLVHAYELVNRGHPIATVADMIGWSGRHLTNRFRAEFGLRPKEVARIARFDRARRAIHPGSRLADVAAAHGYTDQSHLVRDFQSFAGCSPSHWLTTEPPLPATPS